MLGKQIGEEKDKDTGQRVLDIYKDGNEIPKIETNFSSNGKFKGIDTINTVTYWSVPRPGGMLYGEAKGIMMLKDGTGEEIVTFTAYGIGRFTSPGKQGSMVLYTIVLRLMEN
jgi:hypothetical protein